MILQDLIKNRERIIIKIKFQITLATKENISAVMTKIIKMLPQFELERPTMANIDKLTMKAIKLYLKYSHSYTTSQAEAVDAAYRVKQQESIPSSLR